MTSTRRPARAGLPWALALVCLLACACGDDPAAVHARRQSAEAWEALTDYGVDRRDEFIRDLDGMTQAIDVQLDKLRARSARAGEEGRTEIEARLTDLQTQRGDINRRLTELKETSQAAWAEARDGTLEAYRSLRDGVDEAVRDR